MHAKPIAATGSRKNSLKWRIRDSALYSLAQRVLAPSTANARRDEMLFFDGLLGRFADPLIFGIGSNLGSKATIFRRHGRVICIEPDPAAAQSLRERFRGIGNVEVLEAAVTAASGHQTLYRIAPGSAYNSLVPPEPGAGGNPGEALLHEVPTVSVLDLIRRFGTPQYIKLDAEGYEWPILALLDVPIPLISMEFNLPRFNNEMTAAVNHLAALSPAARFNVVISEPPRTFEFAQWSPAAEALDHILSHGWRFAEIFCLSHTP